MKTNTVSNLALGAAFAGLLGGTSARLNAQTVSGQSQATASSSTIAGVMIAVSQKELPKHRGEAPRFSAIGDWLSAVWRSKIHSDRV
jgi:hypothetical protein